MTPVLSASLEKEGKRSFMTGAWKKISPKKKSGLKMTGFAAALQRERGYLETNVDANSEIFQKTLPPPIRPKLRCQNSFNCLIEC